MAGESTGPHKQWRDLPEVMLGKREFHRVFKGTM